MEATLDTRSFLL